jgi:hypothetical protein
MNISPFFLSYFFLSIFQTMNETEKDRKGKGGAE